VRPHLVVVEPPSLDRSAGVAEINEPVLIQTLVSELAVEALDIAVLNRLPRTDEAELDALSVSPCIESSASELRPVVRDHSDRLSSRLEEAIEHAGYTLSGQCGVDLDRQAFPTEIIDDVKCPKAAARRQAVCHEVHRPTLVGSRRQGPRPALRQSDPLATLTTHGESLLAVHALNPLVIQLPALAYKQHVQPPVTEPRSLCGHLHQTLA
jgi:hypothetical protein